VATKFSFITMGCPKNLVDSDNLTEKLIGSGLSNLDNPEDADILLINTCGFIEDAKKESIEEILKLAEIKKKCQRVKVSKDKSKRLPASAGSLSSASRLRRPEANDTLTLCNSDTFPRLIVFGCLAKRYKDELIKEIPEIDAMFGVAEEDKIVEYCRRIQGSKGHLLGDSPEAKRVRGSEFQGAHSPIHLYEPWQFTNSPIHPFTSYTYLKIAEGCSRKCAYCIIPSIRGGYKSAAPEEILKKAEQHITAGAKELILIAQDTAIYGKEFKGYDISNLLRDLCSISGDFWIRLLYAYPASITDRLLNVIAEEKKICKYLDIPLQHSEDRILRLMKRGGSRKGYLNLIRKIRSAIPDIALRTTFIVGFPSETEDEFKSMLDFIEEAQFDRLGAFKYSNEEGTAAAKLAGQLPDTVKNKRIAQIMRHQERISFENNRKLQGMRFRAVIDELNNGAAIARLYSHAPDIDGVVIIDDCEMRIAECGIKSKTRSARGESAEAENPKSEILRAGDFVTVEITDTYDYDLKGKIVK